MRYRSDFSFAFHVVAAAVAAALLVVVLDRFPGGGRLLIELVRELVLLAPVFAVPSKKIGVGSDCQL